MKLHLKALLFSSLALSWTATTQAALIHSYSFSGNANDSIGTANGSVNGATLTTDRFGNANSAYSFDGNDSIVAGFTSPTTATFSLWATWNGTQHDMLFNSGVNGQGPDLFFWGNTISWNTWDAGNNPFGLISDTSIDDGLFHHFAVVNNQSANLTSLFIDGTLFGTAGYRSGANNPFTIGAAASNGSWGWSGKIDDIQIYDTALDQNAISNLANSTVPEPSIIALLGIGITGLGLLRKKKLQ